MERRVLVAEACARLAPAVRPDIRLSLILSVVAQLAEDPEPVVRETAARSLAGLLSTIDSLEKYRRLPSAGAELLIWRDRKAGEPCLRGRQSENRAPVQECTCLRGLLSERAPAPV